MKYSIAGEFIMTQNSVLARIKKYHIRRGCERLAKGIE